MKNSFIIYLSVFFISFLSMISLNGFSSQNKERQSLCVHCDDFLNCIDQSDSRKSSSQCKNNNNYFLCGAFMGRETTRLSEEGDPLMEYLKNNQSTYNNCYIGCTDKLVSCARKCVRQEKKCMNNCKSGDCNCLSTKEKCIHHCDDSICEINCLSSFYKTQMDVFCH